MRNHRGIAAEDARNSGIIEYFKPRPVTRERIREDLLASLRQPPANIEAKVDTIWSGLAERKFREDPPLSGPVEKAPHPWFGLNTHPDVVERLWRIDEALPKRSRWLLWGRAALVHPQSGVVFAVGFGNIGVVMRLSEQRGVESESGETAVRLPRNNPAFYYDISPAGPEWRFLLGSADDLRWGLSAYRILDNGPAR